MDASTNLNDRLTAFGNQLIQIHIWLREQLARLREDIDSYLDGSGEPPRELRAHCLTFCTALGRHHTGEDGGAFPVLATQFPELRPVIEELERDHRMVAEILHKLEDLLGGAGGRAEPVTEPAEAQRVQAELDGLAALLESHFVYEEKKLVAALNSLAPTAGTTQSLLGISVADPAPAPPPRSAENRRSSGETLQLDLP